MSANDGKVCNQLTEFCGRKTFICGIVKDMNRKVALKLTSEVSGFLSSLGLYNIGLHVPLKKTWVGRFVSVSQTIEGIENLLKAYCVNPCYIFMFEYIGGSEFKVEIFNEYAVEIDYKNNLFCVEESDENRESRGSCGESIFGTSPLEKDKLKSTFIYNAWSYFDAELEFVIHSKHLEGNKMTEVISIDQAAGIGLDEASDSFKIGFKKYVWKIKLQWKRNRLLFGNEWNRFATASDLKIGDKCILVGTAAEERFEVVIFHKEQIHRVYKSGSVDGKGQLKWFKMLKWISVHTGEVEAPKMFVDKYGDEIADNCEIHMNDGMVYTCYFSKEKKLVFGLKKLMNDYCVKEQFTFFFDYVGNSKFDGSIFNKEGLEILKSQQEILRSNNLVNLTEPEVYIFSDSNSDEANADVVTLPKKPATEQEKNLAVNYPKHLLATELLHFTVNLLKSHVDQNNHGVYLPRYMHEVYKKWNKSTTVKLIMNKQSYEVRVLRRKKTCRLGVGWNAFTLRNGLEEGQRLYFDLKGEATFVVKKTV